MFINGWLKEDLVKTYRAAKSNNQTEYRAGLDRLALYGRWSSSYIERHAQKTAGRSASLNVLGFFLDCPMEPPTGFYHEVMDDLDEWLEELDLESRVTKGTSVKVRRYHAKLLSLKVLFPKLHIVRVETL